MLTNEEKLAKLALQLAGLCEQKIKIDQRIQSIKFQLHNLKNGGHLTQKETKQQKYEDEIISILKDFGGKAPSKKIQGKYSGKNCSIYLAKMVTDDKLQRVGRGVYALKNSGNKVVQPLLGEENNFSIE